MGGLPDLRVFTLLPTVRMPHLPVGEREAGGGREEGVLLCSYLPQALAGCGSQLLSLTH